MPDPLLIARIRAYDNYLKDRYFLYLSEMFFPEVDGQRQPIFTQALDERTEWMKLSETKKNASMALQGQVEPDFETAAWIQNRDGAHERLVELTAKFGELQ